MKEIHVKAKQGEITGAASSITANNLTASRALVSDSSGKVAVSAVTGTELAKLSGLTVTTTELNYMDGVTSAVQTQLNAKAASSTVTSHTGNTTVHITAAERTAWNGKQAAISGAATTITSSDLTASRALISNSNGKVAVSSVTSTELGYLDGVTSNIQTQLNGKQAAISGTANAVMITDANGKPTVSSAITVTELNKLNGLTPTTTELNYMDGVTSSVQTQINGKIGYPNWSQTPTNVTLYNGLTFTPTKNGYFIACKVNSSNSTSFKVGNVPFTLGDITSGFNYLMVPVPAGVTITSTDSDTTNVTGRYRWVDAL